MKVKNMSNLNHEKRRGYKAEVLLALFFQKYDPENPQNVIEITIAEVKTYLDGQGGTPGNIHNFFKDLVRTGKMSRQLSLISEAGYHLVQNKHGGAFVLSSDIDLIDVIDISNYQIISQTLNTQAIPRMVWELIRTDEGAVISVMEYCRVLEIVMGASQVYRVQSPLKVQPNEVDGCYVFEKDGLRTLLAVEAKSKGSDVLLKHQIYGAAQQALYHFGQFVDRVRPVGIKIQKDNTLLVVTFDVFSDADRNPKIDSVFNLSLSEIPYQWTLNRTKRGQLPLL